MLYNIAVSYINFRPVAGCPQ